jgi:hypothetical protein
MDSDAVNLAVRKQRINVALVKPPDESATGSPRVAQLGGTPRTRKRACSVVGRDTARSCTR